MFKTEIYYQNHRWWFSLLKTGRLGQLIERLICQPCATKKDAYKLVVQARDNVRRFNAQA